MSISVRNNRSKKFWFLVEYWTLPGSNSPRWPCDSLASQKSTLGQGNRGNNREKINSITAQGKETWSQRGLANFLSWAALPGPAATGNASKCYFSELVGCEFLIVNWKILFGLGNNGNNREKINSINAQGKETWSQCGLANFHSWAALPGPATGNKPYIFFSELCNQLGVLNCKNWTWK